MFSYPAITYNPVSTFFSNIAKKFVPRKIKRIILVGTLFRYISQFKTKTKYFLSDVQNISSCSSTSLAFLLSLCPNVWKCTYTNTMKLENLFKDNYSNSDKLLTNYFINKVPEWLQYGSQELIEHDISVIIAKVNVDF